MKSPYIKLEHIATRTPKHIEVNAKEITKIVLILLSAEA